MSDRSEPEQSIDDDALADAQAACTALVPLVQVAHRSAFISRLSRPSSTFVTHLIATLEQVPQTRDLCRASCLDANIAYQANHHLRDDGAAGTRARQTI